MAHDRNKNYMPQQGSKDREEQVHLKRRAQRSRYSHQRLLERGKHHRARIAPIFNAQTHHPLCYRLLGHHLRLAQRTMDMPKSSLPLLKQLLEKILKGYE
jgi:hypothetical protein